MIFNECMYIFTKFRFVSAGHATLSTQTVSDPVYTVPDPHDHDIKLNATTTSVALTLTILLQNLTTSSHRKKW